MGRGVVAILVCIEGRGHRGELVEGKQEWIMMQNTRGI